MTTTSTHRTPDTTATVAIVGGGPAGLAAATELGRAGIDCLLVEPRTTVSHLRPRAKTTSARTMEHLRRWGIADALRAAAPIPVSWSQRVTFCRSLSGDRILDFDEVFGLSATRPALSAEAGQQVPQPVVEQVLRDNLLRLQSVRTRFGHTVTDLVHDRTGAQLTVTDGRGGNYRVSARYVLGCDGATSLVRSRIGARYVGHSDPRPNFNVVFHAPDLETALGPAVQYWVLGERTCGLIGRLDLSGTWWAIFPGVDPDTGARDASRLIDDLVGAPVPHRLLASDPWTARMLIADTFARRRVFLVGDSAHLNPPWGGHGFNTCVGDAVNIAWKIAAVEQGWAGTDLLAGYESERRAVVAATVESATANLAALAGDLACDPEAIRTLKRGEFYSAGLVLGYSYAGSAVVQPIEPTPLTDTIDYTPTTTPGSRLPHLWLADGTALYDHLGDGFTLLGPLSSAPEQTAAFQRRARQLGIPLTSLEVPRSYPWREEFLLVRPDQHIAWRAACPTQIDLLAATARSAEHAVPQYVSSDPRGD